MENKLPKTMSHENNGLEKNILLGIASTPEEKKEIYRFRYHVYIEEMCRHLTCIDHDNRLLYDDLDEWGLLIYARTASELIGTMRVNIGPLAAFPPEIAQVLALDRFQEFYTGKSEQNFALSTRLMVAPHYRNSQAFYLLLAKGYELYCNHQVQFSFGGCNFYLLRLYEQMGFRRFHKNFADPGYGQLSPILLLVDDIDYLRVLRSPYFRLARKREGLNNQVTNWFLDEFPQASKVINSQLVTQDQLWNILSDCLGNLPNKTMPALKELSPAEASKFLHCCGVVVNCRKGDQIITSGDISNELNILLSGKLKTTTPSDVKPDAVVPGQHFGAIGLVEQPQQTQNIISATASEILVLSRLAFPKFHHSHPDIANKVLNNLAETDSSYQNPRRLAQ